MPYCSVTVSQFIDKSSRAEPGFLGSLADKQRSDFFSSRKGEEISFKDLFIRTRPLLGEGGRRGKEPQQGWGDAADDSDVTSETIDLGPRQGPNGAEVERRVRVRVRGFRVCDRASILCEGVIGATAMWLAGRPSVLGLRNYKHNGCVVVCGSVSSTAPPALTSQGCAVLLLSGFYGGDRGATWLLFVPRPLIAGR